MENTFRYAPHQFGLSRLEGCRGGILVTGGDRLFDLAQEGADTRPARFVDLV